MSTDLRMPFPRVCSVCGLKVPWNKSVHVRCADPPPPPTPAELRQRAYSLGETELSRYLLRVADAWSTDRPAPAAHTPPPAGVRMVRETLEHIHEWAKYDGHYPLIEKETREALASLLIVRDALRQYEGDPCTCAPDAGQPSCCACYSRAALKVVG